MQRYNPKIVEPKWQKIWDETGTYTANLKSDKPKYIAMSMFNYPSGAGIHIGHAMNYTISDVKARFKRQQGYESYHPVGWDAFGLPAENYAIKAGVSPQESMATIIPAYHKQYKAMGWSNDWEKEISTHLPEYYKWSQWIFAQMYQHCLAYQDSRMQWWCTKCQTVLANEQVIDGKCWRHDGPDDPIVQKKEVKQWFFKITDYADELLEAIDGLDWTPSVKLAQKNWIGRSEGINIDYSVVDLKATCKIARSYIMGQKGITEEDLVSTGAKLEGTTEASHLEVSFPLAAKDKFEELIKAKMEPGFWNEYLGDEVVFIFKHKDGQLERIVLNEETEEHIRQLGHQFNNQPDSGESVWSWLANNQWYAPVFPKVTCFTTTPVNYGMTFIVLAPEHEMVADITTPEQKEAVESYVAACIKRSDVERQQEGKVKTGVFTGAYALNQLTGQKVPIWVADFVLASFGTGAVQGCPAHDERDFDFAKKFHLPIIRVVEGPNGETEKLVDSNKETVDQVKLNHGIKRKMINSGQFDGLVFDEGMQATMDYFVERGWGKRIVNYKMRDWSVSRQRYWGAPIPIIHCGKCGSVLVPDENLPVILPELDDFQPSGDGRSALARAKDWLSVDCPQCGGPAERETDTLDTFIDSSWYMYRYFDPRSQEQIFDSELVKKWEPIDFYNGADHATAHLLYARFMARFFTKLGLINEPEPFKQFLFNGKVTAADGRMFSKSKGNGIDPLEIINQGYGADALRTYLMFAAPLEFGARWDPQGVPGTYRFLSRVWTLVQEYGELTADNKQLTAGAQDDILRATHRMIKKVSEDIEGNRYNTAIAAMMACVNEFYKLKTEEFGKDEVWQQALENVVACVAPFAPHIAEELWHELGHSTSVHADTWPQWDEKYLASETMTIVVQVNGKVRGQLQIGSDASEDQIIEAAKQNNKVASYLAGHEIKKAIYVPDKLVSFVVA